MAPVKREEISGVVARILRETPITDVHTHIFPSTFGDLLLWGVDELITYHYLIAETFRYESSGYAEYFALPKRRQADLIWKTLFLDRSPVSEAQRGVLTVMSKLGQDLRTRDLGNIRRYCESRTVDEYVDVVFEKANVKEVVMTNDLFVPQEFAVWNDNPKIDPRFKAALRIDPLLNLDESAMASLRKWGYAADAQLGGDSIAEIRRFLKEWMQRMDALYVAASLPPTFRVPEDSNRSRVVEECVLPVCRELGRPFAMMIGVTKRVNPGLGDAGDAVAKADIGTVTYLCKKYPANKFLVTMLSLENQHELAVAARKFRNLMVFGCWWFLNNPSIIDRMTRMRFELLGLSFVPQHSDARILDQLIYKWDHSRRLIGGILAEKYLDVMDTGWEFTEEEIRKDVADLFSNNFWRFLGRK